jgi:lipopolysaccharide transport system permease protein
MSNWTYIIKPYRKWYDTNLKEAWRYKDLLWLFVHRDFVAYYKQTVLGPLWFLIEPLATTAIYMIIFGGLAGLGPEGIPKILFFLSGVTAWKYFADCFVKTSAIFTANAHIFGKVYFPRVVLPVSVVISNMIKFGIQMLLFLGFWIYFLASGDSIEPNYIYIALFPFLVVLMALQGLAFGMIVSALTTKYRDLQKAVQFGVQLLMYASPVVYSLAEAEGWFRTVLLANPMTSILETFKYAFLGVGTFEWSYLAYSLGVTVVALFIGIIMFNRVEKTFMDTV